jgi:hypothetical protein
MKLYVAKPVTGSGRFLVSACDGSKRFTTTKAAVKYARGKSSGKPCSLATVMRTNPSMTAPGRESGEIIVVCKKKVCKPTGWLQRGTNPL